MRSKQLPCVLDVDMNKNILIIYSTESECMGKFLEETRKEIFEKEFDLTLIDNEKKVKLNELKVKFEEEMVLDEEKNVLNMCGFRDNVESLYEKLCDLA